MPILIKARIIFLPGNLASPSSMPAGSPISVLIRTAVIETLRVSNVISRISRSPDRIISIAFFNPSTKSSICNQALYQNFILFFKKEEQWLTVFLHAKFLDHVLRFFINHKLNKCFCTFCIHFIMFFIINLHNVINI